MPLEACRSCTASKADAMITCRSCPLKLRHVLVPNSASPHKPSIGPILKQQQQHCRSFPFRSPYTRRPLALTCMAHDVALRFDDIMFNQSERIHLLFINKCLTSRRPTANQEIYYGIGFADWPTFVVIVCRGHISVDPVFEVSV